MPSHNCNRCGKTFAYNYQLILHLKKKRDCVDLLEVPLSQRNTLPDRQEQLDELMLAKQARKTNSKQTHNKSNPSGYKLRESNTGNNKARQQEIEALQKRVELLECQVRALVEIITEHTR